MVFLVISRHSQTCIYIYLSTNLPTFSLPFVLQSQPRLFSGITAAITSGFVTFTFLEPLFVPVGMDLAIVALYILSINAAFVGLCLGVLLPLVLPGVCFGVSVALLCGCLGRVLNPYFFPIASLALASLGGCVSAWYVPFMFPHCSPKTLYPQNSLTSSNTNYNLHNKAGSSPSCWPCRP